MQSRSPLVGELPAVPPTFGRVGTHPALVALVRTTAIVLAIWAAWFGLAAIVLAVATRTGVMSDPHHLWLHHAAFFWPLYSWDYGWYNTIAFWTWYPAHQTTQQYAFFPIWPLLLRLGNLYNNWKYAGGAVLLSSVLSFAGVAAAAPFERRWRAPLALACWPGSFALLLAYPDAFALALAVWAAALTVRGWPLLAAPLGAAVAATRPNGVLIAIPIAFFAWRRRRADYWLAVAAPVAALLAVEWYFWQRSGNSVVFFDAQAKWERQGPGRFGVWAHHVAHALDRQILLITIGAILGAIVLALLWRIRWVYAAVGLYVLVIVALLFGTQSPRALIESVRAGVILPLCLLLWRLGPKYRPWAAYATAVVGVSVFSGSIQSFGRQALFAFPLVWTAVEGPAILRSRWLIPFAVAMNVALLLIVTRYAP